MVFQITRFESKLNLQHEQRAHFTNIYAEATTHIISENFRQYPVTFGLQKDSMFTKKFGEIMRYGAYLAETFGDCQNIIHVDFQKSE